MLEEPESKRVVNLVKGPDDRLGERLMYKAVSSHGTKVNRSAIACATKTLHESSERFDDRSGSSVASEESEHPFV